MSTWSVESYRDLIARQDAEIERLEKIAFDADDKRCHLQEQNERLKAALDDIRTELFRPGSRDAHLRRVCGIALRDAYEQQTNLTPDDSRRIKQAFIDDTKPAEQNAPKKQTYVSTKLNPITNLPDTYEA